MNKSIRLTSEAQEALEFLKRQAEYETTDSALLRSLIVNAAKDKGFGSDGKKGGV